MFGIIVNPISGGGKSVAVSEEVVKILEQRGEQSCVFMTEQADDGARQVHLAFEKGCSAIVCIGGDGTLSEVMPAMANSGRMLYIVPNGTGNDFARAIGLPKEPIDAFRAQLDGRKVKIDCGSVNGRAFINVSGSGFDVEVLRKTEELKKVYPGEKAYTKAVLAVLGSYQAFEAEVSIDGSAFSHKRCTIIEVANGRYFGGGMLVAPGADYMDGLFDVVTVDRVPRALIPFLLPLFKLGLHIYLPIAKVCKAKEVVIRSKGMVLNIDGGLKPMDEARFSILPDALDMMLPVKSK